MKTANYETYEAAWKAVEAFEDMIPYELKNIVQYGAELLNKNLERLGMYEVFGDEVNGYTVRYHF